MTELETLQRAKMYMDKLARGIDPISDQEVPGDSVLNHVRLARCFYYVSDVLGKVIDNGGVIGEKPPFSISGEQLSRIQVSREPVRISRLVEMISGAAGSNQKKLSATTITSWLLKQGFLEKRTGPNGKSGRFPTQAGIALGLFTQLCQGPEGEYLAVLYSPQAQQFVIDNLPDML